MPKCDFLIVAGGTGGHVFPALSVALELRYIGYRLSWLGQPGSLEERIATENNINFIPHTSPPWHGAGILGKMTLVTRLTASCFKAWGLLNDLNPKVIVAFGGHVTVPVGINSWLQGRKLILHEQNLIPGKANKLLAYIADKIMTGFAGAFSTKKTTTYTGNPLRREISEITSKTQSIKTGLATPMKVLVLGGSNGSDKMNHLIVDAFAMLGQDFKVWHQTGKRNLNEIKTRYLELHKDAYVEEFIEDMASAYQWADVVITRAGAMTIAEVLAFAKPSILIPNPRCAKNHQLYNAMSIADQGAASCTLEDMPNFATEISGKLMFWLANPQEYYKVSKAAKELHDTEDTLARIVSICEEFYDASDVVKVTE